MTLEEILKSLKKSEFQKYETTDDCHRVIEVFHFDDGTYTVYLEDKFSRAVAGSIKNVLKEINDRFFEHWTEFDYEIYIPREELKSENGELKAEIAQLKKALRNACGYICCEYCALYDEEYQSCSKGLSDRFCDKELFDYFLEGGI